MSSTGGSANLDSRVALDEIAELECDVDACALDELELDELEFDELE